MRKRCITGNGRERQEGGRRIISRKEWTTGQNAREEDIPKKARGTTGNKRKGTSRMKGKS